MSQENVDVVRRAYERFNAEVFGSAGDFDLSGFDPDIEWDMSNAALDAAVYRGHDGVREYLSLLREMWEHLRLEPQAFIPIGDDRVVVPYRIISVGRDAVQTVAHAANVWTLHEGKVTRLKAFQSKAEALEAAGLRE